MKPTSTCKRDRLDWHAIRDRIDMAAVATNLLGPAAKRSGRRLLWHCPFHDDRDPSFQVDPEKGRWKCWPCDLGGDAPALVMQLQGVRFPEAVRIILGVGGGEWGVGRDDRSSPASRRPPRPGRRWEAKGNGRSGSSCSPLPTPHSPLDSGLAPPEAVALVEDSAARLWTPEGSAAREYLFRARGLTEETLRRHRLGWTPRATLPNADHTRYWRASGVTIPWFDEANRLSLVKIRQPDGSRLRYTEAFRDRPGIYPGRGSIGYGRPLILVEGEFEALLLGQELADLASVITTGNWSSRPTPESEERANSCWPVYAAHDADDSGDKAAAALPGRSIRVRPPAGKDWTEALHRGVGLRRWWLENVLVQAFNREEREAIRSQ
jgi:hypothetical protein